MVDHELPHLASVNVILRKNLVQWGRENFQSFPWRRTKDPYLILIAELMLHRTQVKQVVPVYEIFVHKYATLNDFLEADESTINAIFSPLGLHWRTRKVIEIREIIKTKYDGIIPDNYEQLICLPGINDYIASAILCFANNKKVILVDTNTIRVISRIQGMNQSDSLRRNKKFVENMRVILGTNQLKEINYSLIDLAHLICKNRSPLCDICPLISTCVFGISYTNSLKIAK